MDDRWLVVKRDLYYMPNDCGYTGIRDHAGVYSHAEACARLGEGISIVHWDDAPEFSKACFDDLAREHLAKQRDDAVAENKRLRAALEEIEWHDPKSPAAAACRQALGR